MTQKKQSFFSRKAFKTAGCWLSILLSLVIGAFYVLSRPEIHLIPPLSILEIIEAKTFDVRMRLRGTRTPGDDIVIVAIDEKTEDELGRWQSSGRRWLAQMLDILHVDGAKVIGFDFTLSEPDEGTVPEAINTLTTHYQQLHQQDNSIHYDMLAYFKRVKTLHDYDRQLAQAIVRAGNVILGMYFFFEQSGAQHIDDNKHKTYAESIDRSKYTTVRFPPNTRQQPLQLHHTFGVEPNLQAFSEAARSFGHFTIIPDYDGYIREIPLLVKYQGDYYPSLDLEILRAFLEPRLPPIIYALGKEGAGNVSGIQIGELYIPTGQHSTFLIDYYGPAYTFPHYSLADVVLGNVPPETFRNKIVLCGFTSIISQDVHSVPFQAGTYPGVEVHATIIENMLRQDFLLQPGWTLLVDPVLIVFLGIVLGIVLQKTHSFSGAFVSLSTLIGFFVFAHAVFLFQNVWLNLTFPALFILLNYLLITTYKYFAEEKKERTIKNAFQHYVAPTVVDRMLEEIDNLKLGGERKVLTVLFADIRDFTGISEKLSPETLVQFLNEFFNMMTETVLAYEGTVDKYMGDNIMAFFGAPIEQPDHAVRACKTALEMLNRLQTLQQQKSNRELPPIQIGVGINSGEMSVGNMGSEELFDYTIMGDHVNLGSRLEGINKQYGTSIVISQFTYGCIQHDSFIMRELDSVIVKGKTAPVTIYELIGHGQAKQQTQNLINVYTQGLTSYRNRKWNQASQLFQNVLTIQPNDPPSKIFLQRCEEYKRHPPPEDWDGVFTMTSK